MTQVKIPFKRLNPDAIIPSYVHGSSEDAGLDLSYCGTGVLKIPAGARALCATGIAIQLPPGFEGQVRPRSGLAVRQGLTVLNAPGTIDPSYRGEIKVLLVNLSSEEQEIRPRDRIAQLVISVYASVQLEEVQSLDASNRNEEGFGSTGSSVLTD